MESVRDKFKRLLDLFIEAIVMWLNVKAAELRWFSDKSQYNRGYWDGYNDKDA